MPIVKCEHCGKEFYKKLNIIKKTKHNFCCKKCHYDYAKERATFKKCDYCGKMFPTYKCYEKRNRKHRFCSKECEGKFKSYNNSYNNWKGGYISKSTGYKYIQLPNGKQIEEHRLVMMKHLNRELKKDEVVHHINGIKTDNRIENLKLVTPQEHQKIHHYIENKYIRCARCGEERLHYARGLCCACYMIAFRRGELLNYAKQIQK